MKLTPLLLLVALPSCAHAQVGTLGPGDPQLPEGEYYHQYAVDVAAGSWLEVDMTSTEFDTYLVVIAPDGQQSENDDHEGSQQRSYLRLRSDSAGTWTVIATSFEAGGTGRYQLEARVDGQPVALRSTGGAAPGPVPSPAPTTGGYQVGDAVQIDWHGTWYPGRILAVDGQRYHVRYDGYSASFDEWVGPQRLRLAERSQTVAPTVPPAAPAPPPAAGQACASTGAATLRLDREAYTPLQPMRIAHAHPQARYMDHVGLVQLMQGTTRQAKGTFVWGVKDGVIEIEAPGSPGSYEARYTHADTGEVLGCVRFEVTVARFDAPATATGAVPTGTYETYFFGYDLALNKWLGGDIEIRSGGQYRFQNETGRYGYDQASGRVVWHTGPLQGVFATYRLDSDGKPAIVIPRRENAAMGIELAVADIWGYLRQADWRR